MSMDDALSLTPYQIAALSQKESHVPGEQSYQRYLERTEGLAEIQSDMSMAQKAALAAKRDRGD